MQPNDYQSPTPPMEQPTPSLQPSYSPGPPSPPPHRRRPQREGTRSILSTIAILVAAPIFALVLIAFVFQSYEVDGPSMERTLTDSDRLIVTKTAKTWSRITNEPYIPNRGEIIVFAKLGTIDPVAGSERQLIKRVIGLPGDRVIVENGMVTIFNEDNPDGFDPDEAGGYSDMIASRGGATDIDISVPDNYLFVMGDNRSNSLDSRSFGIISSDEVVGRLAVRIFPLNEITRF